MIDRSIGFAAELIESECKYLEIDGKRVSVEFEMVIPSSARLINQQILERCIDTKGQRVVSIERLAKELGVEVPSKEEIKRIVEDRKKLKPES